MAPTPRVLELRAWFDITGSSGTMHLERCQRVIERVLKQAVQELADEGITVVSKGGDWAAYYPVIAGNIDEPGRHHQTGA